MDIKNSVAVITGAANGIGASVAEELGLAGAKLVLGDISKEQLDKFVVKLQMNNIDAIGVQCDVTNESDMSILMETAIEKFGSLNIVMANAGIIKDSLLLTPDKNTGQIIGEMSIQDFINVINVNLTGAFLTIREAAKRMVNNNYKGVIAITSSINKCGQVGQLNYASTKAAVSIWPKILAGEFLMKNISNIRVIAIAPGYTKTPILDNMNQSALQNIIKNIHTGKLVDPKEIAATLIHAIENEAIDATCIEVAGGVTYGNRSIAK